MFHQGVWYLDYNGDGQWDAGDVVYPAFGLPTDVPVTGDWDGSGKTKIGVYHQGIWYLDYNGDGQWDAGDLTYYFGLSTDVPVVRIRP